MAEEDILGIFSLSNVLAVHCETAHKSLFDLPLLPTYVSALLMVQGYAGLIEEV